MNGAKELHRRLTETFVEAVAGAIESSSHVTRSDPKHAALPLVVASLRAVGRLCVIVEVLGRFCGLSVNDIEACIESGRVATETEVEQLRLATALGRAPANRNGGEE